MNCNVVFELIRNTAFLFALSFVYEFRYIIKIKNKTYSQIINGCLIGLIGVAIMSVPFTFANGLIFDTRSVLIGVTAIIFGTIPAVVTMIITSAYRIIIGGSGTVMGISVILSCGVIGLLWHHLLIKNKPRFRIVKLYLLGLTIHAVMISCMIFLGDHLFIQTLQTVALPIIIIYPIGTVLLALLLLHQKERNESMIRALEAEERYKSLFEYSRAVMLIVDPDNGQIIDANNSACDFYGWTVNTIRSMNITQINTLSWPEIKLEMQNSVSEKRNYFLFKHRRANGPPIDVEVYSGPIKYKEKTYLYSIVHNISSRIEAAKSLQESESRFRTLVEGAPDAIFIQTDKKFAFVNKACLKLFGAKYENQLIGMDVFDRLHPDYYEKIKNRIQMLNQGEKYVQPLEQIYFKLDGTPVDVDVTAVNINYMGKNGALVFVRDITQRKQLEKSKLEIEAQLRQQQKLEAIGTLAGGVAHEINNPINGIMNYAQLICDLEDKKADSFKYATEIIHETERISTIVKNLLQFSRQEKQTHSYARIEDIINQTVYLIKTIIKKDQIKLEIDIEDDLPDIKCRSQQIQQVLMNLLINAKDALNEKYPGFDENKIIVVSCSKHLIDNRDWIVIVVEDRGNGIAKEIGEKIFEPFFSTKPKNMGTGLGLSISIGIVEDHHGTLTFETKEGQYTQFYLKLPTDNNWN
jgi:PAS domain S-box-containing protein